MSDLASRYEQDLVELIKSAKIIMADKVPIADKEEKKQLVRQVQKDIDEMNSLIGELDLELNKLGPNSRTAKAKTYRTYRLDIELIQKDLKAAMMEISNSRSYDSFSPNSSNDPERKKVLQIHSSLMNTGDSIARSTQIAIETEQIGNNVLGELYDQGDRLNRVNERLEDTGAELSKSRRLIRKLSNDVFYNKFLLVIIIVLELIALGGVIFWKFFL